LSQKENLKTKKLYFRVI